MEFRFNVSDIFKKQIVELNHNLIPPDFQGDKREFWNAISRISEVINTIGEASAAAQGLTKPITTADRLRNSDHKLYLLIDQTTTSGKGAVMGMLKTGHKVLYLFDKHGQHFQVSPLCILDFYVHESHQRSGWGKYLFEHMLQAEHIQPVEVAIDRPSEKFLRFLNKHYNLNSPVKQMNNYVVFDDFFTRQSESMMSYLDPHKSSPTAQKISGDRSQQTQSSPIGRYGSVRPTCSIGQIIHSGPSAHDRRSLSQNITSQAPI
ncbi:unnamed protein product [Phaedon cochleariae]|uniref:Alpha-tubulin N-acetyltransferase n=1 Tax=Phaedon cochleariae TaxID=80249 RepID=A0A9P0DSL7_PHACE|nr:unnamed protein product [Phaedon cochleariae]